MTEQLPYYDEYLEDMAEYGASLNICLEYMMELWPYDDWMKDCEGEHKEEV